MLLFLMGTYLGVKFLGHKLDVYLILISSFSSKLIQSWFVSESCNEEYSCY